MPTIIRNGIIATASETFRGDLRIEDGLISDIGEDLNLPGAEVIDAEGRYVIPGAVDVHTHLNLDTGIAVAQDDFYSGTKAAAFGGTTCIVDHPGFGPKGCSLNHQIDLYHEDARGTAVIDYGLHGVIQHVDDSILTEMEVLVTSGIPSFKVYLTYEGKLGDLELLRVLARLKELGGLTAVHAENDAMVCYLRQRFLAEGKTEAVYHALSRPDDCEAEGVSRVIHLASAAGNAPVYIVHLSTALGLEAVRAARNRGQTVYAETCPQYLLLSEDHYREPGNSGLKYVMTPPARKPFNQGALWQGLKEGVIDVVATDHCPFDFTKKVALGGDDFTKCPGGIPGIETRVTLIFSEGVMKGRLSLNRFVEVVATAPAKIMGLYPQKGAIEVGSDADLVIIDPDHRSVIVHEDLHQNVDYTPYEGTEVRGRPVLTMVRGRVVVKDGVFTGEKGYGRFVRRKKRTPESLGRREDSCPVRGVDT